MMIKKTALILMMLAAVAQVSLADPFEDLAKYKYGDDSNAGQKAEKLVQDTKPADYAKIEDGLIKVLSGEATPDGKGIACRLLQQVGTKKAIPALTPLLQDKVLAHYARLVLERLQCSEADAAMLGALEKAPDCAKIGILGSLGVRRDANAVAAASKLAASENVLLAAAAMQALGQIGTADAAKCLLSLKPAEKAIPAHNHAMVQCASNLKGADATALCEKVLAGTYSPCRIAALRALASADGEKATPMIVKALKGNDIAFRKGALGLIAGTKGEALTKSMVEMIPSLTGETRTGLIVALGERGDPAALAGITRCVGDEDKAASKAAILAVAKLGGADSVELLLGAASSPDAGSAVAAAIAGMTAEGVDEALIKALNDNKLKAASLQALKSRGCTKAAPSCLKLAADSDPAVRREAWLALAELATDKEIDDVMKAVVAIKEEREIPLGGNAIRKICDKAGDKSACFGTIAGYFEKANPKIKEVILAIGPVIGDDKALELEKKTLAGEDKNLAGKALRALAQWPNEKPAEDLLKVAQGSGQDVEKFIALQGYIRIAGAGTAKLSNEDRSKMLVTADGMATRDDEKRLIASSLENVKTLDALKILAKYLKNKKIRREAERSASSILRGVLKQDPALAKEVAEDLKKSRDRNVKREADRALGDLKKMKK